MIINFKSSSLTLAVLVVVLAWGLPMVARAGCCVCLPTPIDSYFPPARNYTANSEKTCDDKCPDGNASYYASQELVNNECKAMQKKEQCLWNFRNDRKCAQLSQSIQLFSSPDAKCLAQNAVKPVGALECCCFSGYDYQKGYINNMAVATSTAQAEVKKKFSPSTPTDPLAYAKYQPALVINRVISTLLLIVGTIALIMFIWGGFTWMTAFGDSAKVAKASKILIWSTLGLFVIFLSYIAVGFILETVLAI